MLASDRNFSRDILGYLITVSEKSVKDDDSVNFRKSPMMPLFTNRLDFKLGHCHFHLFMDLP